MPKPITNNDMTGYVRCNNCRLIFSTLEIKFDKDTSEHYCPYCGDSEGFKVLTVGELKDLTAEKAMGAYKALRAMISADDLKRNRLTLADYSEACDVIQQYARNDGEGTTTIMRNVAEWYKRKGFTITPEGIGYRIR